MAGLRVAEAGARQVGFEDGRRGVSRSVGHRPGFQHQGSAATRKSRAVAAPRSVRFPREQLSVQVESLRFFIKQGYGWRYRVKRSRWTTFVASTPQRPLRDGGRRLFLPSDGRDARHMSRPVSKPCRFTGLNRRPPTTRNSSKLKPQVNGSSIFKKCRYGRPMPI